MPVPRVRLAAVTATAAVAAGAVAGIVFDGAGRPTVGFWAAVWFFATALIVGPLGLLLTSRRRGARRASQLVLGLTLAAISYAAWYFALGTRPISPEGAWLWPLALVTLGGALWSLRLALFRAR